MPKKIQSNSKGKAWLLGVSLLAVVTLPIQPEALACSDGCPGGGCSVASVTFEMPEATISADTLAGLIKSGSRLALLECRLRKQLRNVKIPGARIIYNDVVVAKQTDLLPATDSLVILYPGIEGGNTASVAAELRNQGYLSILEYPAGVYGWITFGYEPEEEAPDTQQ
jgi:hypothetical protein